MKIPLSATEYAEMMKPLLEAAFKKTDLLPGAQRLVKHFDKIGVPMAIATGSCESTYLQKIEQHMHTIVYSQSFFYHFFNKNILESN